MYLLTMLSMMTIGCGTESPEADAPAPAAPAARAPAADNQRDVSVKAGPGGLSVDVKGENAEVQLEAPTGGDK